MSDEFVLVKRPEILSTNIAPELLNAILKTLDTDEAVNVKKIEGEFLSWQAKVRMACRKYGLKVKFRRVKRTGEIYIWAEKVINEDLDPILEETEDS